MIEEKSRIYPLLGIGISLYILVFGLIMAKSKYIFFFIAFIFLLFAVIGCIRACIRILPIMLIMGVIFGGISYLIRHDVAYANALASRIIVICLAIIPGMSILPVDLTRNLNQIKVPKAITLGMLIALNFVPLLRLEVKRVREAMITRGAGSILNMKIFYRAFLIPFITRLINISDTLSLSVETRGFTLDKSNVTIYKIPKLKVTDIILVLCIIASSVILVIL